MDSIVMNAIVMGATAMSAETARHLFQIWPVSQITRDRPKPILRMGARVPQIMAAIVTVIAAFFVCLQVASANPVSPSQTKAGSLLLRDGDQLVEAPRLGADYDLTVSGPTVRGRVTQIFHNHTQNWVEAVYVYPLPEDGAVDTLKMVIGERIVVGEIKERQSARAIYEQAKASGYKTTLIEQERPNIFTNSVANVGPGETVLVQFEYQAPVKQSAGTFSLRIPLVVGPALQPEADRADRRLQRRRPANEFRLGPGRRSGARPRPHRTAGARSARECAGQSGADHGAAAGRFPARQREEPSSSGQSGNRVTPTRR